MRKSFFLIFCAHISFFPFSLTLAQENPSSTSSIYGGAATAGTNPQVGVTFGGVSLVSVTVATTLVVSLLAFALEDSNATSSSSTTN